MERRVVIPLRYIVSGVVALFGLYLASLYNYLLFHTIAEMFSVAVAWAVFMLAWNSRRFMENNYFLFIGIAFVFIGGVDLLHTLAYKGMGVFPERGANLPTQLWIAGRYLQSLSFLIAPLFLGRKLKPNYAIFGYTLAFVFLMGTIFYWNIFPDCFVEGMGLTAFKKISEYIISAILLASIVLVLQKRNEFETPVLHMLVAAIVLTMASELAFTFYISVYGFSNLIGHYFKIISFYLIYKAIVETGLIKPYGLLFRNLKQNEEALRKAYDEMELKVEERTSELAGANEELKREITQRKLIERSLRESEERFRTFADSTYDWESWAGPDGKYIYVSPSCERITGYSAEKFMKDPGLFTKLVHPDDRGSVSVHIRGHLEGTGENHIDFRIITRGDDIRWISHYCQPVYDEDGKWLGMRASNRDITDRITLGEQLTQSQKMEGIGKLAGGVAHDFNNLLTTIIGYTEMMLMQVDKDSPLRTGMDEIKKASDRAASLTSQLLAFSRKQMIQPVVLNLNYSLAEMDKMLRRLIGEDIDLATILEPELWRTKFDAGQLDQVVINLAVNAKDALPKGGKLTIETANVDLDEAYARLHGIELKPGPFVMLSVSDTGMGIDKETLSHIFEPFFTTKETGKGTGLGLSTVYGIVKQSGGFIWVYSEPGQGSTFKIYLPKTEEEIAFAEEEQMQPQDLEGSETILLAEDDDSARKLIRSALQEHGYRVLEAQDGKEALQLNEHHKGPIHLLLTDVVMPGMSGRKLAERLQPLQPKMKVLYMSGYTDNAIVHHGVLESGMPFIQKPFTPKVLVSKVRKVLDT